MVRVSARTATHACFKSACGKRQRLIRQLLLCDTKDVGEKCWQNSMLEFEEKWFHVLICDAGTAAWRNKCWFMEMRFKNSSWQVCTQAVKLAQLPWMTYWRTRSSPQNVSAVIIIWDCTVWKWFDPQHSVASFWSASVIEYRPSWNWEKRIRVCLITKQSGDGFAVHWWWFLCSFFKNVMGKMGCFWLTDCEDEDQTSFLILTSMPLAVLKSFIWTYAKYFSLNLEEVQR